MSKRSCKSRSGMRKPVSGEVFRRLVPDAAGIDRTDDNGVDPARNEIFDLAGLFAQVEFRGGDEELLSFAIVTTSVHEKLAFVHTRQPALLSREEAITRVNPAGTVLWP